MQTRIICINWLYQLEGCGEVVGSYKQYYAEILADF